MDDLSDAPLILGLMAIQRLVPLVFGARSQILSFQGIQNSWKLERRFALVHLCDQGERFFLLGILTPRALGP